VLISIIVDKPTPFFDEFLNKIEDIDYPKSRLCLSITTLVNISYYLVTKLVFTLNFICIHFKYVGGIS